MGFYDERILPRIVDRVMGVASFGETRARVLKELDGEVLEIGFGTGHNLPHYPPTVTHVHAIEPSERSIELARDRVEGSPITVHHAGRDAQRLEIDDGRFATVVSTWTLCTIPRPLDALAEIRRVLAPRGSFHFVEHGRSPHAKSYAWQRRIEPVWKRVGGGCQLTREIDALVTSAGFEITRLRAYCDARESEVTSWTFEGVAVPR
jgi:ubiquinone/menaquinone biosynthesis C-methylase UbiE